MDKELTKLIEDHIKLAESVAYSVWNTARYALELEELQAIAYSALVASALRWKSYCEEKKFNPEDTQFFKAVAQRRMRGAIYDELRSSDWASRTLRSRSKMLREAGQEQGASVEEMTVSTGLTEKMVRETIQGMNRKPVSLEVASTLDYADVKDVESVSAVQGIMAVVIAAFKALPIEGQIVIALKYHQELSMKDIALELGLQTVKVSQIHAASISYIYDAMYVVAGGFSETEE